MMLKKTDNAPCMLCTGKEKRAREVFVAEAGGLTWVVCHEHLAALLDAQTNKPGEPKKQPPPAPRPEPRPPAALPAVNGGPQP